MSARPTPSASATSAASTPNGGSSTVSIPQTAANGGITMTNPAQTAAASYYKIAQNNFVTFGWNFTSLYVQPESLTLVASASGGNTYPITTLPGTATAVVWSPYDVEQSGTVPLAIATYTLSMWDERGPKATPTGGRMSVHTGLSFALYRPQSYTPLSSWTCASCSSAGEVIAQPFFLLTLLTGLAMLVGGWNVFRNAGRRTTL